MDKGGARCVLHRAALLMSADAMGVMLEPRP
jgi:hypothetical protein